MLGGINARGNVIDVIFFTDSFSLTLHTFFKYYF